VGLALAASIAVVGANVSTQALKVWTAEPRPVDSPAGAHVAAQSWPSGHATAAAALALCLVVVAPSRLRLPAAIVAGAFALGVACSVLVLGWHLPSDAMGGFCVAAAWTLAAVALAGAAAPQTEGEAESPAAWRPGSGGRNGRDEPSGRIGAGVQGDAARPREPES
jgi:membrane-associated phospholipid phosphatase